MEAARTLIRTVVRAFYVNPKQILIIDALLIHSVLHADDLNIILSTQQKEIRKLIAPLKKAQLLDTHSKVEAKVGQTRGTSRDYYYIPLHPAIDAIKFRVGKLTDKVKELYEPENERKDWRCPRCKSEYDMFQVLNYDNDDGFSCEKCGTTLEETTQAKNATGMFGHETHSRLMDQLSKILSLMQQVDRLKVPENDFDTAWEKRKEVPRERGQHARKEYVSVPGSIKVAKAGRTGPEQIKQEALGIKMISGEEHEAADQARREAKKVELAKQNMLPVWHTQSTVSGAPSGTLKAEEAVEDKELVAKVEMDEETKPISEEPDEIAAYLADMKKEREEAERLAAEEDLETEEDGEDEEFEDVTTTALSTPLPGTPTPATASQEKRLPSSQTSQPKSNGVKREFDYGSPLSSEANTPAAGAALSGSYSSDRGSKKVKFDNNEQSASSNGVEDLQRVASPPPLVTIKKEQTDSDEDEEDFEDAM
jgi:transcription initiation factor TFIIE subunit alpha